MSTLDITIEKNLKIKLPDNVKFDKSSKAIMICDSDFICCFTEDGFDSFIQKEFTSDIDSYIYKSDDYLRIVGNSCSTVINEDKELVIPNEVIDRYELEDRDASASFYPDYVFIDVSSRKRKK